MTFALGPDGPWALYLGAGMVATVNPCGFAMLPAYLSYFLGVEGSDDESARAGYREALRVAAAVSGGFLAVFAVAAAVIEAAGSAVVYENTPWVSIVIGLALLALGIAMLCGFEPVARLPRLDRGGRTRSLGSMFVFGVSYAVASIGCSLPVFLVTVTGTMERQSVLDGLVTFGLYATGMAVVLTALTVTIAMARTGLVRFLRQTQPYIGRVAGGLVALTGAYVAHYGWEELREYDDTSGTSQSTITQRVTGWSYDISEWIRDVGAVRLTVVLVAAVALLGVGLSARRRAEPAQGASRESRQPVEEAGSRS